MSKRKRDDSAPNVDVQPLPPPPAKHGAFDPFQTRAPRKHQPVESESEEDEKENTTKDKRVGPISALAPLIKPNWFVKYFRPAKKQTVSSTTSAHPLIRCKWWDKIDTWIATSKWKKVLVLIGPSGTGKTYCIHHYIAEKLKVEVHSIKPYFATHFSLEQQVQSLGISNPQAETQNSPYLLHISLAHPLEMLRSLDWKWLETIYLDSTLELRSTLPYLVIECRRSELSRSRYSPLHKRWKQVPNSVDVAYSEIWSTSEIRALVEKEKHDGNEKGERKSSFKGKWDRKKPWQGKKLVRHDSDAWMYKCIEKSHNDMRQFQFHWLNPPSGLAVASKKGSPLSADKGMIPLLAELFTKTAASIADLRSVVRVFPANEHLDYRFLDLCLVLSIASPPSGPTSASKKEKIQDDTDSTVAKKATVGITSRLESAGFENAQHGGLRLESKGFETMKSIEAREEQERKEAVALPTMDSASKTRFYKPKIIDTTITDPCKASGRPVHLDPRIDLLYRQESRRLEVVTQFYARTKAFAHRLLTRGNVNSASQTVLHLASLALVHHLKWEWDHAGYSAPTDQLWSILGKRISSVRLFLHTSFDELV